MGGGVYSTINEMEKMEKVFIEPEYLFLHQLSLLEPSRDRK